MRVGWTEFEFSDFLTPVRRKAAIDPQADYKMVTLPLYGRGARLRKIVKGSDLGSSKFEVRTGDLMISKIDARKGSNSLLPTSLDGAIVTGDFLSYKVDESLVTLAFFDIIVRSPMFSDLCDTVSAGTTNRVRLDVSRFLTLRIPLPSLAEQQRIVDLIGSLDEAIEAADASHEAQLRALNNSLDAEVAGDTIALGDLATIKSGASWAAAEGSSRPIAGAQPVLTIVNTRPNGSIDLTERTYVQGLSKSAASITKDSLVMIRTNGNRSRIGNVYRSTEDVIGDSVSAFQFVVEPITTEGRDFLFWSLRAPSRQELISDAASGSTGLGNIAAGWLKTLEVPWPDGTERGRLAALWESLGDTAAAVSEYASSLRHLRTNLLTALLSGAHEIPVSYDDQLSEAV